MVSDHPPDIQVFDFNALILSDELSRLFEMKVTSLSFCTCTLSLKEDAQFDLFHPNNCLPKS